MSRRRSQEKEGGIEGQALYQSVYRAFACARAALSMPIPDIGDIEDEFMAAFMAAVNVVKGNLELAAEKDELGEDSGLTWSGTTHQAYLAFQRALEVEVDPEAELPWKHRLAFEAMARHTANCLDYFEEEHGELSDHENEWHNWAIHKSQEQGID